MKRGITLLIISVLAIAVFAFASSSFVLAQEDEAQAEQEDAEQEFPTGEETTDEQETDEQISEGGGSNENEDSDNIEEEEFDEEETVAPVSDILDEAVEENEDAELAYGEGITPDSGLYFIEEAILSNFRDDLENREKKIAEFRAMIEKGDKESAREALERYYKYTNRITEEIDPEKRSEARRSAAAIHNALEDIEDRFSEEERQDFAGVLESEGALLTATEIASKIKDLCVQLSGLDPLEYSRVCKTDDGSPNWLKRLDDDLTNAQREEARKFGEIMEECFRTSGQECSCNEIPYLEFAAMCSIAAPLATACDVEGNEEACDKLDEIELPELPDYLQDVMDDIERQYGEASYDNHIPGPCREVGIIGNERDDREKCFEIMIETEAPPECRQALRDANVKGEREARGICEKIMFENEAPQECIDSGLNDFRECGKFMFRENAPKECVDAGLTGENRNDPRKCEEIMRQFEGDNRGSEYGFGGNCREIKDAEERLKCYDGAISGSRDFDERLRRTKDEERKCAENCRGAWDFSGGVCNCRIDGDDDYNKYRDDYDENEDFRREYPPYPSEGEDYRPPEEGQPQYPPEDYPYPPEGGDYPSPDYGQEGFEEGTFDEGAQQPSSQPSDSSSGETTEPSGESAPVTGAVIFHDNPFLRYFFGN